jgi:xylulokinase
MPITSPLPGFAEQEPEMWWAELVNAVNQIRKKVSYKQGEIAAIGISYQMHGLVCVDKNEKPVRSSIIWCDSRAVELGNKALLEMGETFCLDNFLNSPGNFTASKLMWVKENQPEIYSRIHKVMLPGDYIALKLTGAAVTKVSGLSEGILWNFRRDEVADELLKYYGIDKSLLSPLVDTFGKQGRLTETAGELLGLEQGVPVCYRAGDQPNNAYSLNVLDPGEIAATAGTSGVVYGVTDQVTYDPKSRVNTFVHVNHTKASPRYGVLLCINGTGILNSWLRKNFFAHLSYDQINKAAETVNIGSDGLLFYPFGNGAERVLENKDPGALMKGLQFNRHQGPHVARAAQEGIVFALNYGMETMKEMGLSLYTIRAGYANMFLSEVFAATFANTSGCEVELYNTDGAFGAARAAGVGVGLYASFKESFSGMNRIKTFSPGPDHEIYKAVYEKWKSELNTN